LKLALIGYGRVGRAFARLLESKRAAYPFRIVGIHTARHGTALNERGLSLEPEFGPPVASVEEFLERAKAEVMIELTPLNPTTGEPAISHIRAAFARRMHVITANKGPVAHACAALRQQAEQAGVQFRFEAAVMDGAPVFNLVRYTLPGVEITGFSGVLNSTSTVVLEAMERGLTLEKAVRRARRMGITEADPTLDLEGWDAAAKTAALANALMQAGLSPLEVARKGITGLKPERLQKLAAQGKTVRLVSRARRQQAGWRLSVRPEVLARTHPLAMARGTSNLLCLETDLMGTIGILSVSPGLAQTAYGLFSDLVAVAREA